MQRFYQITVEGRIDPSWSDWLGNLRIDVRKENDGRVLTTISGVLTDQAALRGLVNRLWDLNLTLHSVQQLDPTTTPEVS